MILDFFKKPILYFDEIHYFVHFKNIFVYGEKETLFSTHYLVQN